MSEVNHTVIHSAGAVHISDDVITIITNIAAKEIEGVKELKQSLTDDIGGIFNKKSYSKGVKVEVVEEKVYIDLAIIVNYGVKIPEISWKVQENVKQAVESMTELKVEEVNVHVNGINFSK